MTQKNQYWQKSRSVIMVLYVLAAVSACAANPPADNVVAERAQARWDALLAGDYAAAYVYYSPGYRSSKSAVDLGMDIRTRKVKYRSAQYQDQSCEKDTCTVRVEVGYEVTKPVPGLNKWESKSIISEKWIKSDGEWWFLPQK